MSSEVSVSVTASSTFFKPRRVQGSNCGELGATSVSYAQGVQGLPGCEYLCR